MQQADDFVAECEALHGALESLDDAALATVTQFKSWTIDDVVRHLHFFNRMVDLALLDPARFAADYAAFDEARTVEGTMTGITERMLAASPGLRSSRLGGSAISRWVRAGARPTPRRGSLGPDRT